METKKGKKHIAIIGGGPSGLFVYKRLVDAGKQHFQISIFEKKGRLGPGMPYSTDGANDDHITNVSDREIPAIVTSVEDWVSTAPPGVIKRFHINSQNFNEYKVLPRLFFGEYLSAQFELLQHQATEKGITTNVFANSAVTDIIDCPGENKISVVTGDSVVMQFDCVIICTGHNWPLKHEGIIPGYFDSPYPPSKLILKINYPVALKGASLTAIDAIRTLAKSNGAFVDENGMLSYQLNEESQGFKIVLHSLNGLLPAIRFHLEDLHLSKNAVLSMEEVTTVKAANEGFIPLDYLFEKNFKDVLRKEDPEFYEKIKDMSMEDFVESMMSLRERLDPFQLFKAEYAEAEKSMKRQQSIYWKEMLAVLSFAMNYPAKHFSAEDMLRLKKVLMPLVSIVIALVPQSSAKELLALYDAGVLQLIPVGEESTVIPEQNGGATYTYTDEDRGPQAVHYKLFIDCTGQPHLSYGDFPFKTLLANKSISPARLKFRNAEKGKKAMNDNDEVEQAVDGAYYLRVPGITINDHFQVVDEHGANNNRIYIMAAPYIGGYNPDYSGLDFCEEASARIVERIIDADL